MNGSMAEGISTSFQTCPPDPHGLHDLEGLPSPPSLPLHVNDLGLTPPPGSQLQLSTKSSQHEERKLPTRDVNATSETPADPRHCTQPLGNTHKDHNDEKQVEVNDAPSEEQSPADKVVESRQSWADTTTCSPQLEIDFSAFDDSNNATEELYDPLFDSELVLQEIDAVLQRKRNGDEAFPEDCVSWDQSRKRQATEMSQYSTTESPDKTPSLLSLDSGQPEQGGTGPHTPSDVEKQQSDAVFDSIDLLFEDPSGDFPLDIPDGDVSFNFDIQGAGNGEGGKEDMSATFSVFDQSFDLPSVSEITKERFSLDHQDIVDSTNREALQRVFAEPEYVSPYPLYGGPLGYIPSAPNIHVRCIEVSDDRTNLRLATLRNKVQQLTLERNKYKQEWALASDLTAMDPATGKTKQQTLLEQNAMLRRVCSRHQQRVEQYKQEAIEWKNKLHDLGTIYNNLLYEIQVQKQMPAVAPIPTGYKPPRARQASSNATSLQPSTSQPQSMASTPNASVGEPITIDLTEETGDDGSAAANPTPEEQEERQRRVEMLQSLRNKKYSWLGDADGDVGNQNLRISVTPAPRQGSLKPAGGPHDSERSRDNHVPARGPCEIASDDRVEEDDDELARMMEQELASPIATSKPGDCDVLITQVGDSPKIVSK
ncbi:similar to An08g01160 [Aspergillus niger]|uniref:Similar to An08g01160 n=1 Tax=Aspergillus niger TaxID=5061 RepID=A0A100IHN7_ASPNG|nr:similar to An08g01160 [Aspergillus niger]